MKNNLILTNLVEQSTEDVERKLLTLLFEKLNMPFFPFTHKDKEFQWKCLHNINYTEQMNLAYEKCHLCQIKDSDEMIQHLFFKYHSAQTKEK
jgi:hypothetical protein